MKKNKFTQNPFLVADSLGDLSDFYHFSIEPVVIDDDLDNAVYYEDINRRKRLDAEVLSIVAANAPVGTMLDIGTYLGHSAARMAANSPRSMIITVNIHPDDIAGGGRLVTGVPRLEEIGSFYRARNLTNITQVFADTKKWKLPDDSGELSLAYIDGCHDMDYIINDTLLVLDRLIPGGFILWHDFSPVYRSNYNWIHEVMCGLECLVKRKKLDPFIINVRNSWIGIWRKKKS